MILTCRASFKLRRAHSGKPAGNQGRRSEILARSRYAHAYFSGVCARIMPSGRLHKLVACLIMVSLVVLLDPL
ncbi:hypothetical protein BJX66DRAFT_138253 [Aspergillus keveii]|uniref:Uncharacterized protein n=1 Tax=Aspergillus keveii TaxID=714993 RepID=A0ABR4FIV4_9EURO